MLLADPVLVWTGERSLISCHTAWPIPKQNSFEVGFAWHAVAASLIASPSTLHILLQAVIMAWVSLWGLKAKRLPVPGILWIQKSLRHSNQEISPLDTVLSDFGHPRPSLVSRGKCLWQRWKPSGRHRSAWVLGSTWSKPLCAFSAPQDCTVLNKAS